mgnify:CR=1 FL=1
MTLDFYSRVETASSFYLYPFTVFRRERIKILASIVQNLLYIYDHPLLLLYAYHHLKQYWSGLLNLIDSWVILANSVRQNYRPLSFLILWLQYSEKEKIDVDMELRREEEYKKRMQH